MSAESVPFRSENYNKIVKNKLGIQNVKKKDVPKKCLKKIVEILEVVCYLKKNEQE